MVPLQQFQLRKRARKVRRYAGLLFPVFSLSVLASAMLLAAAYAYLPSPPDTFPIETTAKAPTDRELLLLASDGTPFARRGGCYDTPVSIDEVPQTFINALLATEDRRFYSHVGIDPVGVVRALRSNMAAGKIVQGGSTITQQLAKISYLSPAKSVDRKIREAIAVLRLEFVLSKDEILERYLSRAYFGQGCFGLRAAARKYFDQAVSDLTLPQSAMLVALLKSPGSLSRDRMALREREKIVLEAMVDDGRLSPEKRAEFATAKIHKRKSSTFGAYYADWLAETVTPAVGTPAGVLTVKTGLDRTLQSIAERAVRNMMQRAGKSRTATEAALVAMRPDGRVVAMVGGLDYDRSQFNRASQALRQPGSSFKAFVYLTALKAGGRPDMLVVDEPVTIGDWTPENYGHGYQGLVPLRRAFSASINTVAVKLTNAVGPNEVARTARDLGIKSRIRSNDPSLALGTSEVTLLELTSAYAAFAANAYPVKPWGIVSLQDGSKTVGGPPEAAGEWRLPEGPTMREFLSATVQHGTGYGARLPIPAYGKTGTSQNYRDAWFIGFAGNLVVGVWVGNDDNSPMRGVTGGSLPAMIWRDFMNQARVRDREFRPSLPGRIAAFPAKTPVRRNMQYAAAMLRTLEVSEYQYAWGPNDGAFFGNAMLIGRSDWNAQYPRGYQWGAPGYPSPQPRQSRRREAWNPFRTQ